MLARKTGRQQFVQKDAESERQTARGTTIILKRFYISGWDHLNPHGFAVSSCPSSFLISSPWYSHHCSVHITTVKDGQSSIKPHSHDGAGEGQQQCVVCWMIVWTWHHYSVGWLITADSDLRSDERRRLVWILFIPPQTYGASSLTFRNCQPMKRD